LRDIAAYKVDASPGSETAKLTNETESTIAEKHDF